MRLKINLPLLLLHRIAVFQEIPFVSEDPGSHIFHSANHDADSHPLVFVGMSSERAG